MFCLCTQNVANRFRCTMSYSSWMAIRSWWSDRLIERNEWNEWIERKVRLDRLVCCIFAGKTFLLCKRPEVERKIKDDRCDSKNKKKPPAYVRIYVRRKGFYILSVISVICHLRRLKMYEKQVHVFGSLGAPVFVTQRNRRNRRKQEMLPAYLRIYVRRKDF